jgi:selenocysteine lyase/cysteine desulfurase
MITAGTAVIVTGQDHEANIGAWERLCQRNGAELRTWAVDPEGELRLDALEPLVDDRVRILCMTHSSNIVGSINPVEAVIRRVRPLGVRVVVDGVSFAPHSWPDIPLLKPDAYCFSTYKTYAPHLGIMYVAESFARDLDPQCHYFNLEHPEKRFDAAGPDHASIAALAGLGDYFAASHQHHFGNSDDNLYQRTQAVSGLMNQHETALCQRLLDGIADLPLEVLGKPHMEGREANIALYSRQASSESMSEALGRADIAAGHGHFYAKRLLENAGIEDTEDGVLRVSFSHYNTTEEVDRVVDVLVGLFP